MNKLNVIHIDRKIPAQEFVTEMKRLGGDWQGDLELDQAVFRDHEATVYVSLADPDAEDEGRIAPQLGGAPRQVILLEVGRAQGSQQLAARLGGKLASRWGGILEDIPG